LLGFLFSQFGLAKFNKLQAAEDSIKDKVAFGSLSAPVEVYVFTDWECISCRKVEPVLEKSSPDIMKKARLIYVDLPVHPESMNFTPYNLSFMIHNKPQYFRLRDALTELSTTTQAPTDEQVEALAKKLGVKYKQLNYADVSVGTKYFQHIADQFKVDRTPTVVIVNKDKKKGKKLIGGNEITEDNIMRAIDSLSK
jgi:protein-disulfide isomerase